MPDASGTLELTWLGHSTTVLDLGPLRLVTDPLLRRHNTPLRRRGRPPRVGEWWGAQAVLLSHLHHDHADLPSLRALMGAPVHTSEPNARWLRRHGVNGVGLREDEWLPLGPDAEVRLVRAVHRARPMPHRPNAAHGHLVRSAHGTVWFAGDTSLYDELPGLPDLAGGPIDLAVVPVGGWGPRLSPGHMGPREAALACAMTGAREAIAVHWGTLHLPGMAERPQGWMDRPGAEFATRLADLAPACRLLPAVPGDRVAPALGHPPGGVP